MKLLLAILLLFALESDAQISSSVFAGARFAGAVDTGGSVFIQLPGCPYETEFEGMVQMGVCGFYIYSGYNLAITDYYVDLTDSIFLYTSFRNISYTFFSPGGAESVVYSRSYVYSESTWLGDASDVLLNVIPASCDVEPFWAPQYAYLPSLWPPSGAPTRERIIFSKDPINTACPAKMTGSILDVTNHNVPD